MKNFTNNFKQFTSRLSARWLIMALMLLVGTSSAWGAKVYFLNNKGWTNILIYYWGGNAVSIGWGDSKSMTSTGDKINGYDVYSYDFGDKAPSNIIFRGKSGGSDKQTVDIGYSANTCWQLGTESGGKYPVSVVTYTPSQSATFSFSLPNELYVGTPADITYTLSPNAAGTVSFSCTTNNATINGTQITANSTGTVTVKATIKYNTGYTGTANTSKSTTAYIPEGVKLYLKPTGWTGDGAKFSAYLFTGTTTNTWATASSVCNDSDVYEIIMPSGKWTNLIWCRMNPSGDQEDWSGSWGQTVDLTYEGKNLYTINNAYGCGDNKSCGVWGTYTPPSCCTTLDKPSLTKTNIELCNGDPQNYGTIKISNYNSSYSYTLNDNAVTPFKVGDTWYITDDIEVAGDYTVTVDVSGSCESKTATINIPAPTDNTPAIGEFSVSSSSQITCSGTQVTLEATNVNGASYQWFLNGSQEPISGATSRIYEPTITANAIYKVVVSKTSNSCTASKDASVSITAKPVPTANDFSLTGVPQGGFTYNRETQVPEIETSLQGIGPITPIYYLGNNKVNNPTDAGTYTVKISVAAGATYCAMAETEIGTFTITQANQAALNITNSNTNVCGTTVTVVAEGGSGNGAITYDITADNTDTRDASIDSNTGVVTVKSAGSVTVTASKAGDNNYNVATPVSKTFSFTMPIENVNLSIIKGLSASGDYCVGTEIQLKLTYTGATPANDGSHLEWVKDGFSSEIGNNEGGIATGATWTTTLGVNDKTLKVKLKDCNGGWVESNELTFNVFERPSAPKFNTNYMTVCQGQAFTLPGSEAEGYIWSDATGKPTTPNKPNGIDATAEYYAVISFGCPSDATKFTVNVNPLPTITLTANNTNVNVGETVTLTAAGSNFTSLDWSSTGGTFTPGNNTATLTSAEDANITVTVTATSKDGCTATATIQVIFGSEDCEAESSANYIEVLCRTTGGTRDMYCYAWTGSNTEKLGAWPGQKTKDDDYTYDGTTYAYWKIEGDAINIIFNNGSGTKTGDITGLEKGKRYVFTISTNYQTVTKTVDGESIFMPEVETTSITPVRNGNTTNVTLEGRVVKKGCANIVWYGFQYSTDGGDTYKDIKVGETDLELGRIFNHTQAFALGTYMFRAKMINNNGSKVYGEPVRVTVAERDLSIAAVHNDVSVDTGTYYDFVGLYMSSISKPTNVDIVSYTWYKDGAIYNPTFTESSLYGDTYINSNGTNNIRPNQTGTYKLVVALSNGATLESNEINITKGSKVSASSILDASNRTLPVISVRTNEDFPACKSESFPSAQASNLKKKRSVDVKIFDKDGNLYYDRKARMNYRGSSSLNFVKKSYAFCPGDEMCGDVEKGLDYVITKKVNMFNLGAKDKDWVLYAAAADPSMMRNRIVFDTYANMTGEWGVKSMYVELVVDGEYKGVYVFMDKITNNKDRVNITNAAGFIVKFDKTDKEDRYVNGQDDDSDEKTFVTSRTGKKDIPTYGTTVDQMFEIEYPEKDDNKANWSNIVTSIQKRFENFETALEKGDYATVRSIIDYTSWADWFILNEYIKNQDAYRASCIFVYNGEKIEARPVWDQELSFNNTCHTSHNCGSTSNLLIQTASIYSDAFPAPFWFTGGNENITGGLLKDGCFVSLVKERWATHVADGMPLNSETLTALLNKFDGELTKDNGTSDLNTAQKREAQYWSGKSRSKASCGNGDTGYGNPTYDIEKGNISEWINGNRSENLSAILEDMKGELSGGISITMNPANGTVTPWIPVKVTVNVDEGTKYTYDDKSITTGITEDTDKAIVSSQGNVYTYTFPRPESWGTGNDNGNTKDTRSYIINAALVDQSTECPGLSTEAIVQVKLADEGDDYCTE